MPVSQVIASGHALRSESWVRHREAAPVLADISFVARPDEARR
jgi:hypothetical protein